VVSRRSPHEVPGAQVGRHLGKRGLDYALTRNLRPSSALSSSRLILAVLLVLPLRCHAGGEYLAQRQLVTRFLRLFSTTPPLVSRATRVEQTGRIDHWPELDGLRGLAILLVIAFHSAEMFSARGGVMIVPAMAARAGWLGVQLFFVLSGFLITHNLLKSRGAPNFLSAFFARRVLRIFPLYYLMLLMFLVVLPLIAARPLEILKTYNSQIWIWVFLSNWHTPSGRAAYWFPHFWSLAVEEQFYLVWPFVILILGERLLLPFLAFVVVAAIFFRESWLHEGVPPQVIYTSTVCRMDALACGALGALLMRRATFPAFIRRYATFILIGTAGLLVVIALQTRFHAFEPTMMVGGYTGIAVAMAGLLLVSVGGHSTGAANTLRSVLALPALQSVGKVSYAMYVFHLPLFLLLRPKLLLWAGAAGKMGPLLVGLEMIGLSYLAGVLSYLSIERWFLGLKGRFTPRVPSAMAN
jgi:peptidoglycan/LPS O-acetylase OafA/YrhL